ncbi:MAG: hypothetical protein CVU90_15130 [Firmicutes bacterium HGW-Firmicutes-15]|jgi:murein DD-endopeptidase MepM/ murein hydrolase activator NlpD|nr:MAG: hypothetical protein CVU90_15130 [Firmicutes bacterium HGW-Firmicutes-15]
MFAPLEKGYLTQAFKGSAHWGVDLGWVRIGLVNPPIRAWDDGIVIASYFMSGGGNTIAIRHEGAHWYQTRYLHLHERRVKVGDIVRKGQIIGLGGNTGSLSTGPHLHFEVLLIPIGYKTYSYWDVSKFGLDPLKVTFFTEVTGTGVQKMTELFDKLPLAIPKFSNVRIRSTPALLATNQLGHVPMEGLRFVSVTKELIDGYQWAKLIQNGQEVYAAYNLLDVKENIVTKLVEKIVEVEKPINVTLSQDGVSVTIVKEVLK